MTNPVSGYVEGFYGRLLDWPERQAIVDTLARHEFGSYLYAPKEDVRHRYRWREPYDDAWHQQFAKFCAYARARKVTVIAGVAPGLDFDFADLPNGADFTALLNKCQKLIEYGAGDICLLMDDIDADFHTRNGGIEFEGEAHALLANALADALPLVQSGEGKSKLSGDQTDCASRAIQVVPRIYADELSHDAVTYLPRFIETLDRRHALLYCGSDIVAESVSTRKIEGSLNLAGRKVVVWDNLYANDYCPRKLFLGPWSGREAAGAVLLNPTGMLHTDCLLLDIMAATQERLQLDGFNHSTNNVIDHSASKCTEIANSAWRSVLASHHVPEAFFAVAEYFCHPVFNSRQWQSIDVATQEQFDAIEHLLWRWKSPLSREWYPFIMSLKHDLLINEGRLPELRIQKTQSTALATHLLKQQ